MADPDHNPEAYRLLFGLIGGGMLLLVLAFIVVSGLVIPGYALAGLVALWVVAAIAAVAGRRRRPWLPLAAGTLLAVVWIAVLTIGSAVLDWSP